MTVGHARDLVGVQQTSVASIRDHHRDRWRRDGVQRHSQLIMRLMAPPLDHPDQDTTAGTTRMVLNYPNARFAPAVPLVINFSLIPAAAAGANWTVTQSFITAFSLPWCLPESCL